MHVHVHVHLLPLQISNKVVPGGVVVIKKSANTPTDVVGDVSLLKVFIENT